MNNQFFHITLKRNLPLIMKDGLIPQAQHWDSKFKAVFFWDNLEFAKTMCCDDEIILQVDVPEEYEIGKMWNEAHFVYDYYVCEKIPPTNLRVVQ